MPLTAEQLQKLCEALRQADSDIIDIIQFGSSVYTPDLARDVDILVTTRAKKDDALYWDAIADDAFDDVDLMVKEHGEPLGRDIALSVVATGRVLYGDGETLKLTVAIPTYERARKTLGTADQILALARQSQDEIYKDEHYKLAFDRLFDAARYAAMAFLGTKNSRWDQIRKALPRAFGERFREIINTLHIQYGYDGNYPRDDPDGAFARWRRVVSEFIDDLPQTSKP